jgi:large subunit ribosomal protein L18
MKTKTIVKAARRIRLKAGIRKRVYGTTARPRLSIFRSNTSMYAQIINDDTGLTIVSLSTRGKAFGGVNGTKSEKSLELGKRVAELARQAGIEQVVFDRNGFKYHGRVKAVADGAREGGLTF